MKQSLKALVLCFALLLFFGAAKPQISGPPGVSLSGTQTITGAKTFSDITLNGTKTAIKTIVFTDSPYTVLATDNMILVDTTGGNITVSLPAKATSVGRELTIKHIAAANTTTIDGSGAETIDGAATLALTTQYSSRTITCNSAGWWIK